MPVVRYFLFVGGVLLALLLFSNAVLPKLPEAERTEVTAVEAPVPATVIRIHSDRKWPERIVFDTNLPTVVAAPAATTKTAQAETSQTAETANTEANVAAATTAAEYSAKARVRETFAQFRPSDPIAPEPKLHVKRKIAKAKVAPPMRLVAQQTPFGFFGNNTW
jgi:hypothetical protein